MTSVKRPPLSGRSAFGRSSDALRTIAPEVLDDDYATMPPPDALTRGSRPARLSPDREAGVFLPTGGTATLAPDFGTAQEAAREFARGEYGPARARVARFARKRKRRGIVSPLHRGWPPVRRLRVRPLSRTMPRRARGRRGASRARRRGPPSREPDDEPEPPRALAALRAAIFCRLPERLQAPLWARVAAGAASEHDKQRSDALEAVPGFTLVGDLLSDELERLERLWREQS